MDKRSPNFTSSEIDFLLAAVKKYSIIIESKKNDRVMAEKKLNAWKIVEREFNCKFTHTFRPHKVLKTKYWNIKATAKQNFALDKRQTYATGGGPPQPTATTSTDEAILEICQEAQILGKTSSYDCDANEDEIEFMEEFFEEDACAVGEKKDVVEVPIKKEVDDDTSWVKYTPKMLKKPVNKSLKQQRNQESWAKVAEAKLEKQRLEIEFLKEKHNLEIEKLKLEISLIKLKTEKLAAEN